MIFKFERAKEAEGNDFAAFAEAIEAHLEGLGVPLATTTQLMIAFDELISNALAYGAASDGGIGETASGPHKVVVQIDVKDGKALAEVADNGQAFDPLTLPDPDTTLSVEDREIGGLGVHIVRKMMDDVSYSRDEGWNRLRFSKTFELD